jgi:hypothetical protein
MKTNTHFGKVFMSIFTNLVIRHLFTGHIQLKSQVDPQDSYIILV